MNFKINLKTYSDDTPNAPKNENGLTQLIMMGEKTIHHKWVNMIMILCLCLKVSMKLMILKVKMIKPRTKLAQANHQGIPEDKLMQLNKHLSQVLVQSH